LSLPKVIPPVVGSQHAELSDGVGVFRQPGASGLFEAGVQDVFVPRLDQTGTDGQCSGDGSG
jgi:hypothetical protein